MFWNINYLIQRIWRNNLTKEILKWKSTSANSVTLAPHWSIFKNKGINNSTLIANPQMKIAIINSVIICLSKIGKQLNNTGNYSDCIINNSLKPHTNSRSNPSLQVVTAAPICEDAITHPKYTLSG